MYNKSLGSEIKDKIIHSGAMCYNIGSALISNMTEAVLKFKSEMKEQSQSQYLS